MNDVILLFGGTSSERRVSVASAQHVAAVLEGAALWFWAPDGAVFEVERGALLAFERPFETDFAGGRRAFDSVEAAARAAKGRVVFPAVHGGTGEDGTLQGLLEREGVRFTGSGAAASAIAFDKQRAKDAVAKAGVRVAASALFEPGAPRAAEALAELFRARGKLAFKPVADGSSHGLVIVDSPEALAAATARLGQGRFLAEAFVEGRELTVGVVERPSGLVALPPSEVRLERGRVFDYDGKYLGKGTVEITPAEVPPEVTRAAQELAVAAHRACGLSGYSRTDLILGSEGPIFLEVNTLPGLTRASFLPQQLAVANVSMRTFLEEQLALARR